MTELSASTSRRSFARWLGAGAALAALRPWAAHAAPASAAPSEATPPRVPATGAGPVLLNSNENPYGPPPAALAAMREAMTRACRYPDEAQDALSAALARDHGTAAENVVLGAGSSQILHATAAAFAAAGSRVVTADPTFEALGRYATVRGADVRRVPLTADFRHDLEAMRTAAGGGGLLYVCNPNNPTATLTPALELKAFLAAVPESITVLVDEAYHHYADGDAGYTSMVGEALARPNVVVARTFSKIFGMAGLRCGYAVGTAATIQKLRDQIPFDPSNAVALAGAEAALGETAHVAAARARNRAVRAWTVEALTRLGARELPSSANFFMSDLGRDVGPVIQALREHGVRVGRRFAGMPNHLRVTVGLESEMKTFVAAFDRVVAHAAR